MKNFWVILKRELAAYFNSPIAYVFIIIFLMLSAGFTFFVSGFYDTNQADLRAFFSWHPWLYLFLIPSASMRLWAEERRSGTVELLLTLPVTLADVVLGKFVASWLFVGLALFLTFPMVFTVAYLGAPDGGVILAGYLGSFLMAGAYLAIGCAASALTRNQVVAFILAVVVSLLFVLVGFGVFTGILASFLPSGLLDLVAQLGFITHFDSIQRGVLDSRDLLYFLSVMGWMLAANVVILEARRGE